MNFQALERFVGLVVGSLIGSDQKIGVLVTTQLSFGRLCVLAESLFEHRVSSVAARSRFAELMKAALKEEEDRNQLFHSSWGTDVETGDVVRLKLSVRSGKGLNHQMPTVSEEVVNALADRMAQTAKDVLQCSSEAGVVHIPK